MAYQDGFPVNNMTATSLANIGENKQDSLTITLGQVALSYKPIVKAVDPNTGKNIPSTVRVRLGNSSNDTFTEVYSLPVLGKHFMYTEIGGVSTLIFDATYNNTPVTVTYLAKGDFVDAELTNNITADLASIENNLLMPDHTTTTPIPSVTTLYKIIVGTVTGSGAIVLDLSLLLADVTNPTILAFPISLDSSISVVTTSDSSAKSATFSVGSSTTINYQIYVYKPTI